MLSHDEPASTLRTSYPDYSTRSSARSSPVKPGAKAESDLEKQSQRPYLRSARDYTATVTESKFPAC